MIQISIEKAFLALAVKAAGGTLRIPFQTFKDLDVFEINLLKDENGDAVLTLIEGEEAVRIYLEGIAKAEAKSRIYVP